MFFAYYYIEEGETLREEIENTYFIFSILIFICAIEGIILYFVFHLYSATAIIFAAATFFGIVVLLNILTGITDSKLPQINAKVLSSERVVEKNDRDVVTEEYYVTIYEVDYNGHTRHVKYLDEKARSVGSRTKIIYNEKNNSVLPVKVHKECHSFENNRNGIILVLVMFVIGLLIQLGTNHFRNVNPDALLRTLGVVIGIVFLTIVGYLVSEEISRIKNTIEYEKVPATLIHLKKCNAGNNRTVYRPVYEYWYRGERYEYCSPLSAGKKQVEGSRSSVYVSTYGDIYEKSEMSSNAVFIIAFGISGLLALSASIIPFFIS